MSCTKRRQKAVNRRRWVSDLRVARGLMPLDLIAAMHCSCGRVMWLRDGADTEAREMFDREAEDHRWCDDEVSA